MSNKTFEINGHITDSSKQQKLTELRVEAWDKDLIFNDFLGSAVPDDKGYFKIIFIENYFKEIFFDRRPDLFFKVNEGNELLHSTEKSVIWNFENSDEPIEVKIPVLQEAPSPEKPAKEKKSFSLEEIFDGAGISAELISKFNKEDITDIEHLLALKLGRYYQKQV